MADLTKAGGERYAQMAALAYRQSLAGCRLGGRRQRAAAAVPQGEHQQRLHRAPWTSSIPQIPAVPAAEPRPGQGDRRARARLRRVGALEVPVRPARPRHLSRRPTARSTAAASGPRTNQMPVEESGNMLLLCVAAIAQMDGNADFASRWWPQLTRWADYLEKYGFDPENQLCTDDFMGHLAHNANLSVKAILAWPPTASSAGMRGDHDTAAKYQRPGAGHGPQLDEDGRRRRPLPPRLRPAATPGARSTTSSGTSSSASTSSRPRWRGKEMAFYKTVMQTYGLPLDSRKTTPSPTGPSGRPPWRPIRATFEASSSRCANSSTRRPPGCRSRTRT